MYEFVYRNVANQPEVRIKGESPEHILQSRFFSTYTYDGMYEVVIDDGSVRLKTKNGNIIGVIGWIYCDVKGQD